MLIGGWTTPTLEIVPGPARAQPKQRRGGSLEFGVGMHTFFARLHLSGPKNSGFEPAYSPGVGTTPRVKTPADGTQTSRSKADPPHLGRMQLDTQQALGRNWCLAGIVEIAENYRELQKTADGRRKMQESAGSCRKLHGTAEHC